MWWRAVEIQLPLRCLDISGEDVDVGGDFANNAVSRAVGGPNLKQRKRAKQHLLGSEVRLSDPHQCLLGFLLVPQTHRQEVAPGALLAGPLVELSGGDVVRIAA